MGINKDQILGWVGSAIVLVVVGTVVLALFPETFRSLVPAKASGPVATNQNSLTPMPPPITKPKPGLIPFEQAPTVRFKGRIQQVTEMVQRDGQIHIWIHDISGKEMQVSVAPGWYLQYMGCTLGHDTEITGMGFSFDNQGGDPLIYARQIQINGRNCRLRNDEGFALWSNRLR
ncbi:MAG: hypothetical protein G8345_16490 [Magnetococcales bacterium]|nr:hypothetical protein [Magnetococcales bacterium]NGZ28475.1 hypothetical protein [Magnetococcales bacterium]